MTERPVTPVYARMSEDAFFILGYICDHAEDAAHEPGPGQVFHLPLPTGGAAILTPISWQLMDGRRVWGWRVEANRDVEKITACASEMPAWHAVKVPPSGGGLIGFDARFPGMLHKLETEEDIERRLNARRYVAPRGAA